MSHDVASDCVTGGHVLCNAHQILHGMPQLSELGWLFPQPPKHGGFGVEMFVMHLWQEMDMSDGNSHCP